LHITLLYL